MLKELSLKNYLLLEDFSIQFHPGFNVITGETGSGKSILLEGLRILLGETVTKEELCDGDEKAYFELIYEDEEELMTLTREVFPSGRSVSRLNGEIVNLSQVREKMETKLDFYGQRDHSRLLSPSYQHRLLLAYDAKHTTPLLNKLKEYRHEEERIRARIDGLTQLSPLEKEALESQKNELETLQLDLEKDLELEENFDELLHSREILDALSLSKGALEDKVLPGLYELEDQLQGLQTFKRFQNHYAKAMDLRYELEALGEELGEDLSSMDVDEDFLMEQEARYSELRRIKKKYQRNLEELQIYLEEIRWALLKSSNLEEERKALFLEQKTNYKNYLDASNELLQIQEQSFVKLKENLQKILTQLELPGAEFALEIKEREQGKLHELGHFSLSFLVSMNQGSLRPMAQVLSGGEMSRLMLAIKAVFSTEEQGCMIFDEIDTGISGQVAHQVGKVIEQLSASHQIIAISHLPQVVAFSDAHYYIQKKKGTSRVRLLNEEEHVHALATMMSAQSTSASLETAKSMIQRAKGGNS